MKAADYFPSKYLKAVDLQGKKVTLTISSCALENVGLPPEPKPVLYFRETQKCFVLNKTNYGLVSYVNGGDEESDNWGGLKISLVAEMKTFQGKPIMGISVRPPDEPVAPPIAPTNSRGVTKIPQVSANLQREQELAAQGDPDDEIPF